ncbi:MAG: alpha/beta hydrolase [Bacteroidota bacterium]
MELKVLLAAIFLMISAAIHGQIMKIWPNEIPNSIPGVADDEIKKEDQIIRYSQVGLPTIEAFIPSKGTATGQAVIICPGGGYGVISYDWEGTDFAKWLNGYGIAAFVLKYRLPKTKSVDVDYFAPIQDLQRSIQLVRSKADEWNINENQIGVMGFSAGGHLASTLGTQWNMGTERKAFDDIDALNTRPDFMVLIYPVISMIADCTHQGSMRNLLGNNASPELQKAFSAEHHVTTETPPTFLLHAQDDKGVLIQNSLLMYEALIKKNIPTEMHLFPKGGHGFAFAADKTGLSVWPEYLIEWLEGLQHRN